MLVGYFVLVTRALNSDRLLPIFGTGTSGVLRGAGTFFLTFAGFQRIAVIASEVKEPKRTIPRGIYLGFSVSAVLFVLAGVLTLGALGAERMRMDSMPLLSAAQEIAGRRGAWVVVAAAVLATLTTLAGGVLGMSRVAQAMGWGRELPAWMAAGEGTAQTPRRAVLTLGLSTAAITLFFNLRPLIDIANAFTLLWYGATNYAATRLSDAQRFASPAISWFGVFGCIVLVVTFPPWAILLAVAVSVGAGFGRGIGRRVAAR